MLINLLCCLFLFFFVFFFPMRCFHFVSFSLKFAISFIISIICDFILHIHFQLTAFSHLNAAKISFDYKQHLVLLAADYVLLLFHFFFFFYWLKSYKFFVSISLFYIIRMILKKNCFEQLRTAILSVESHSLYI